ncbi:MAG: PepSY domain-containing protein [Cyanobacteria bacterium P01_D01_bin.1]
MKKLLTTGFALSLLAATSVGCSRNADDDIQENTQYQSQAEITLEQAKQTAEAAQGESAIGVELDEEDGNLVYEVGFADTDVFVDAIAGNILTTEPSDDSVENAQYQSLAKVTLEQAKQTAEAAQGETAISVKLDEEDNSLVYEVGFVDADVFVDAGTGDVLATELETDSEDPIIQGSIQVP